jgi:hypothetical protein
MRIIENFKCPVADFKITGFSSGHQFGEDPRLRWMPGFPTVGGKKKYPRRWVHTRSRFFRTPPVFSFCPAVFFGFFLKEFILDKREISFSFIRDYFHRSPTIP